MTVPNKTLDAIFLKIKQFVSSLMARSEDPREEQCPVCGYYCSGKGGFGCIDKPKLIESILDYSAKSSKAEKPDVKRRRDWVLS